jgi:hypothetical protein
MCRKRPSSVKKPSYRLWILCAVDDGDDCSMREQDIGGVADKKEPKE